MTEEGERKIIIDEDWKTQVEREREQLRAQKEAAEESPRQATSNVGEKVAEDSLSAGAPDGLYEDIELPPASLAMLISTLATQSLAAMGQLPDPETGKPVIRPNYAKYQIDMLAMLQEKSKGNVSHDEAQMLEGTLHELRMIYVQFVASQKK